MFYRADRRRDPTPNDTPGSAARSSLVAAFANGVSKDKGTIEAAIALPWSNRQTEGQACKLKRVKRQWHGRGDLDLFRPASLATHKWRLHRKRVRLEVGPGGFLL
jgi:hypothetical protein